MFRRVQNVIALLSLVFFLPVLSMQKSRLDLLPAEVSFEIAKYYIHPIVPQMVTQHRFGGGPFIQFEEDVIVNTSFSLKNAMGEIKKNYEIHTKCKKNNLAITIIFLEHLRKNFIFTLDDFDKTIQYFQKYAPIVVEDAMKAYVLGQQKRIAQEHELFCETVYSKSWFSSSNTKMKKLIELGVNINTQNEKGRTPLMLACRAGNLLLIVFCKQELM